MRGTTGTSLAVLLLARGAVAAGVPLSPALRPAVAPPTAPAAGLAAVPALAAPLAAPAAPISALPAPAVPAAAALSAPSAAPSAAAADSPENAGGALRRFFDGVSEHLGFDLSQLSPEAAQTLRVVHTPPSSIPADDGGGQDYPRRALHFNGVDLPSVVFRPNSPGDAEIVRAIDATKTSVRLALYEFSSRPILEALQRARRRGVQVEVIVDYSNAFPQNEPGADYRRRRSEQIWALVRDGEGRRADNPFRLRVLRGVSAFGINHNKLAVFDDKLMEFGSYNYSITSERSHYENINFSDEKARVDGVNAYWEYLWKQSVPEAQAKNHAWPKTVPEPPAYAGPMLKFRKAELPLYVLTPGERLEKTVAAAIDAAQETVDYAMFSPRSTIIAQALKNAVDRGLRVRAVVDESQSKSEYFKPYVEWLSHAGVEVKILGGPNGPESDFPLAEKMHDKFMVLDGKLVETGSANHTKRASMDNYENAQFLPHPTDVAAFDFHFKHLWAVARPFERPERAPAIPSDEQLREDILHPSIPAPKPPLPEIPLPAAETVEFRGAKFPETALRPYEPVEPFVVQAIDKAQKTVRMAIYQFEQPQVLAALQRAKKERGVKVEIVIDRGHVYTTGDSHEGGPRKPRPQVVELINSGFDVLLLKGQGSGIMHHKFLIVDDELLQAGSYNYTDQSETDHFEFAFFTREKARVDFYRRGFEYLQYFAEHLDRPKLDAILKGEPLPTKRVSAADAAKERVSTYERSEDRTSKFPPPPAADAGTDIEFHGRRLPIGVFSPQGGIEDAVVAAIEAAEKTVDVAMFSFYSHRIAHKLLEAKDRGVKVRLVLDKGQASLSKLDDWFSWHDFEARLVNGPDDERDPLYQKMHLKLMVVDGRLVEAGSFNYSPNAEKNSFENSNWFDSVDLARRLTAVFERMFRDHGSKPRKPRREPVWKDAKDPGVA